MAAFTVALPVTVKVQVLVLLPEHAPDQIALLPPVTLRVTAVPMLKDPWPLDPDATLMPAGLETTLPLRPLAVTVTVPVCGCGFKVSADVRVTPPPVAVMVAVAATVTAEVAMANVALVAPGGTVMVAGTRAAEVLLLDRVTRAPPEGAALASVTVPTDPAPPTKEDGDRVRVESATCWAGATVSTADTVFPPPETEIVTGVEVVTALVEILKLPVVEPNGTTTVAGTMATAGLLDVTCSVSSPGENVARRALAIEVPEPPSTVAGLSKSETGGSTLSTVCTVLPSHVAVMVTGVLTETALVVTGTNTHWKPGEAVTDAGTVTAGELLERVTTAPLGGTCPLNMRKV